MATSQLWLVRRPQEWVQGFRAFRPGYRELIVKEFLLSWPALCENIRKRELVSDAGLPDLYDKYLTMSGLAADWQVRFERSTLALRTVQIAGSVAGTLGLLVVSLRSGRPYTVLSYLVAVFVLALLAMSARTARVVLVAVGTVAAAGLTVGAWYLTGLPVKALDHLPSAVATANDGQAAAVGITFAAALLSGLLIMILAEASLQGAMVLRQAPDVGAFRDIHRVLGLLAGGPSVPDATDVGGPELKPLPVSPGPVARREMIRRIVTAARAIRRMRRICTECTLFRDTAKYLHNNTRLALVGGNPIGDDSVQADLLRYLVALCRAYYGDLPRIDPPSPGPGRAKRWTQAIRKTVSGIIPLLLAWAALAAGVPATSVAGSTLIVVCVLVSLVIFLDLLHGNVHGLLKGFGEIVAAARSLAKQMPAADRDRTDEKDRSGSTG